MKHCGSACCTLAKMSTYLSATIILSYSWKRSNRDSQLAQMSKLQASLSISKNLWPIASRTKKWQPFKNVNVRDANFIDIH